jgi:outer membrane protein TolC
LWTRLALCLIGSLVGAAAVGRPPGGPGSDPPSAPPAGTILRAGEVPIDLGSALRLAGAENPELLIARQRVAEATAVRQLAAAQLLPNLNVGVSYDLHRGALQQSTGNLLRVNRDSMYVGLGASAVGGGTVTVPGLNYNLNVGEGWYGYLSARQRGVTAAAAAAAVRNDVLLRVYSGYLDLLRGDGRRAIAAANRAEAAELARLTAEYARAGQGRQADADRAAVELRRRDAELAQAEGETLAASARLAQLLNLDPSTLLRRCCVTI